MTEGCGGRLCRACRSVMRRMSLERPCMNDSGEPTGEILTTGWVCGFICPADTTQLRLDLPGRSGGELLRMVVAASSPSPPEMGDVVTDRGKTYDVVSTTAPDGSIMLRERC